MFGLSMRNMPACGFVHSVLLKSDGTAAPFGENWCGQCNIPGPPEGITYTQVAAGGEHTVLLKSDGTAAASGGNFHGCATSLPWPTGSNTPVMKVCHGPFCLYTLGMDMQHSAC